MCESKNSKGERGKLIDGPVYTAKADCKDRQETKTRKIRPDARCR
jgi:hypothetical protein